MFDFDLPNERIARHPPERRDGGRLLVLDRAEPIQHGQVTDLPQLLEAGDLLVVNDTRVMHARLAARRRTGGLVEVFLLEPGPGPVRALLRPARRLKEGEQLNLDGGRVILQTRHPDGLWTVLCDPDPVSLMERFGEVPLPPYLRREAEAEDAIRYQTTYARVPGAVAAPTAGLHLSMELRAALLERGVGFATVTLHVGIGTFRPLCAEDLERGLLHPEHFELPQSTVDAIQDARRVIAVGTTTTRALESASATGVLKAGRGVTRLFIREGFRFQTVDGLLTNFHLPGSSLLMLVCAFGGRERVAQAYGEAIESGYRFYSYGDAMLLL